MDAEQVLNVLLHGNQLKRTTRTGWGQRGVALPENVAAHSYGVVYAALLLCELVDEPVDLAGVLAMAVLHDLPEGLTTDIPPSVWRFLPAGAKSAAEHQAMEQITAGSPVSSRWMAWWEQLRRNDTAEARLVHDADKIDQYLQAHIYELQTGNRQLEGFWLKPYAFHFAAARSVYEHLCRIRATRTPDAGEIE